MKRLPVTLSLLLLPLSAFAASSTPTAAQALIVSSAPQGNAYIAGASVLVTTPTTGDLTALGGTVVLAAPVAADALLLGGTIGVHGAVGGDVRAVGGSIDVQNPVQGDLVAVGLEVRDDVPAKGNTLLVAANATIANGAKGPVTIYANNVALAGPFGSDVTVVASGRVSLAASTTIAGDFTYEAPEPAVIPSSVKVFGAIHYKSASYLPGTSASRTLALASLGIFLLVRILGALILAGLLAGLFPRFAEIFVERAHASTPRSALLTMLLGFAALAATPVLFVLLALTLVGIGIAALLFILYGLLFLLSIVYAAIVLGSIFVRRFLHRDSVLWHDGVIGMLLLSILALVPIVGIPLVFLLMTFTTGTLILLFFQFAFARE